MSIIVENPRFHARKNDDAMKQRAHFMPSHIAEDGEAHVQQYFEPYITNNESGGVCGTFRGRPLDGVQLPLPPNHRAVLLTEAKRPLAEDAHRKLQVSAGFTELVYWNYDKLPSKNDALANSLQWIDIADAMHGD